MQFSRANLAGAISAFNGQLVALVLFVTGLLKFVSFGRTLTSTDGLQLSNHTMFGVGVVELILSLWLLTRSSKFFAPLITLIFFCGTFSYGIYGLTSGKKSCPCLGHIDLPIVYGMVFSLFAIVSMSMMLKFMIWPVEAGNRNGSLPFSLSLGVILAGIVLNLADRDWLPFPEQLRSHQLEVWSQEAKHEFDFRGSKTPILVHAENKSKHSKIFVNGCELSSCIADCYSPNIPFSLAPGESKDITVFLERPEIEDMNEENWQGFCKNLRFEKSGLDITRPMPMYIRLFTSESETPRSVPVSISVKKEFLDGLVTRGFSNHRSEREVAQSK